MSELQYRIWCDKMLAIDGFYRGDVDFNSLASALEPPLDAAPISDQELLNQWYALWGSIEDLNAVNLDKGIETTPEMVKDKLEAIRKFFVDNMNKVRKLEYNG